MRSDPHSDRPASVFPRTCRPPGNALRRGFASPLPVTREGKIWGDCFPARWDGEVEPYVRDILHSRGPTRRIVGPGRA